MISRCHIRKLPLLPLGATHMMKKALAFRLHFSDQSSPPSFWCQAHMHTVLLADVWDVCNMVHTLYYSYIVFESFQSRLLMLYIFLVLQHRPTSHTCNINTYIYCSRIGPLHPSQQFKRKIDHCHHPFKTKIDHWYMYHRSTHKKILATARLLQKNRIKRPWLQNVPPHNSRELQLIVTFRYATNAM